MSGRVLCAVGRSDVNAGVVVPLPSSDAEAVTVGRNNVAGGDLKVSRKAVSLWYNPARGEVLVRRVGASEVNVSAPTASPAPSGNWVAIAQDGRASIPVASEIQLSDGVRIGFEWRAPSAARGHELGASHAELEAAQPATARPRAATGTKQPPGCIVVEDDEEPLKPPVQSDARGPTAKRQRTSLSSFRGSSSSPEGEAHDDAASTRRDGGAAKHPFAGVAVSVCRIGSATSAAKSAIWKRGVETLGGVYEETSKPFTDTVPGAQRHIVILDDQLTTARFQQLGIVLPSKDELTAAGMEAHTPAWLVTSLEKRQPQGATDFVWAPISTYDGCARTVSGVKRAGTLQSAPSGLGGCGVEQARSPERPPAHDFMDIQEKYYPNARRSDLRCAPTPDGVEYDARGLPCMVKPLGCYQCDNGAVPAAYLPWLYSLGDDYARVGADPARSPLVCPFSWEEIERANAGLLRSAPWLVVVVPDKREPAPEVLPPPPAVGDTHPIINPYGLTRRPNYNSYITDALKPLLDVYASLPNSLGEDYKIKFNQLESAIGFISSLGRPLEDAHDLKGLPSLESKTISKVDEVLHSGTLGRAGALISDVRSVALREFCKLHGVGPVEALRLYHLGARTLEDLRGKYYHHLKPLVRASIKYAETFASHRLPRPESESVHKIITAELDKVKEGCVCALVGSYRRGKETSADIDILVGIPLDQRPVTIMEALHQGLRDVGLIHEDLNWNAKSDLDTSGADGDGGPVTSHGATASELHDNSASVTYLGVCVMPGTTNVYRRLDITVVRYHQFPCALVQWTGNLVFNRTIRQYANNLGLDLTELGIYHRQTKMALADGTVRHHVDMKCVPLMSEFDVFSYLGLHFIPPEQRNPMDLSCCYDASNSPVRAHSPTN